MIISVSWAHIDRCYTLDRKPYYPSAALVAQRNRDIDVIPHEYSQHLISMPARCVSLLMYKRGRQMLKLCREFDLRCIIFYVFDMQISDIIFKLIARNWILNDYVLDNTIIGIKNGTKQRWQGERFPIEMPHDISESICSTHVLLKKQMFQRVTK